MTDFNEAYDLTGISERGYSFNVDDVGGETYNGISRKYNPNWEGWVAIDNAKDRDGNVRLTTQIQDALCIAEKKFYYDLYWLPVKAPLLGDQDLANMMFDIAVNGGVKRAGMYLQRVLNVCNRDERDYKDLVVDGKIGTKTIDALEAYLSRRSKYALLVFLCNLMVTHWFNRAETNVSQETFINGIGNRWVRNSLNVASRYFESLDVESVIA